MVNTPILFRPGPLPLPSLIVTRTKIRIIPFTSYRKLPKYSISLVLIILQTEPYRLGESIH